jgi:dsDNA-specific endonuclease/ATPase MutS2
MTRAGIPVPAATGARVDVFDPVLADIGDLQSVTGDLSTFSGHLMVRLHTNCNYSKLYYCAYMYKCSDC